MKQNSPVLHLRAPGASDREAVLAYRDAFLQNGESMDGTSGLRDAESYEAWLSRLADNASEATVREGFVPDTLLLAVEEESGALVGMIDIRHRLNAYLLERGGHIGYSVAKPVRGRGVATRMLALALEQCAHMGISRVLVTCGDQNLASARVIEKNGGVLEDQRACAEPGGTVLVRRYWITPDAGKERA